MNKALSFKILSVFTIRFLFVLVITTSNFKFDVLPLINDWKVYLLFIILWFLFEIFFNQNLQNHYLFIFFGIGFLKMLLILYTKNFDLNIFYGAPDSIPLKELGGTLLECFQYSRNCGGEPHFQRGPSYSILISIFTLGTKISPIFLIIIQIFLYAFINTGIIKKINSKNSIVNSSIMILLAVYPSLSIFSRIVLYEIWGVFCLFIAWYISNENKDSKRNYYYYYFTNHPRISSLYRRNHPRTSSASNRTNSPPSSLHPTALSPFSKSPSCLPRSTSSRFSRSFQ